MFKNYKTHNKILVILQSRWLFLKLYRPNILVQDDFYNSFVMAK